MKFELNFKTNKDTFDEDIPYILRLIAENYSNSNQYHNGNFPYFLNARDINGNIVGTYRLKEEE